jgi:fructokinase
MGPKICLVTMGEKGCYYAAGNFSGHIKAYKVEAVDATGCGDSFVSSVLYGISRNSIRKLEEDEGKLAGVLKYASAAAALTATRKGVIPSLPLKDEVDKYISLNI